MPARGKKRINGKRVMTRKPEKNMQTKPCARTKVGSKEKTGLNKA